MFDGIHYTQNQVRGGQIKPKTYDKQPVVVIDKRDYAPPQPPTIKVGFFKGLFAGLKNALGIGCGFGGMGGLGGMPYNADMMSMNGSLFNTNCFGTTPYNMGGLGAGLLNTASLGGLNTMAQGGGFGGINGLLNSITSKTTAKTSTQGTEAEENSKEKTVEQLRTMHAKNYEIQYYSSNDTIVVTNKNGDEIYRGSSVDDAQKALEGRNTKKDDLALADTKKKEAIATEGLVEHNGKYYKKEDTAFKTEYQWNETTSTFTPKEEAEA